MQVRVIDVRGKNPASLSGLLRVIADDAGHMHWVEAAMTQQSQYHTPVLTGVVTSL